VPLFPIKFGAVALGPFMIVMGIVERELILVIGGIVVSVVGSSIWYWTSQNRRM
jgi:hypothetical protein